MMTATPCVEARSLASSTTTQHSRVEEANGVETAHGLVADVEMAALGLAGMEQSRGGEMGSNASSGGFKWCSGSGPSSGWLELMVRWECEQWCEGDKGALGSGKWEAGSGEIGHDAATMVAGGVDRAW
jgi:hypothetical protein